jgi:hypothetical protein
MAWKKEELTARYLVVDEKNLVVGVSIILDS